MNDKIIAIKTALSMDDRLCQLAEEAAELSKAALKLRRAMSNTNPTTCDYEQAAMNIFEEFTDVLLAARVMDISPDGDTVKNIYQYKLLRWYGRVNERNAECEMTGK